MIFNNRETRSKISESVYLLYIERVGGDLFYYLNNLRALVATKSFK